MTIDVCHRTKTFSILEHTKGVLPSYGCEQGPSLSVLYFFHKWWTFLFTTTKRPATATFHWEAPCSIFPLQRHHSTAAEVSHAKVPRGCVLFNRLSPRQVLVPKLKRRCWETHFHSMLRVGRSQSPSTTFERSTVMQRFSGSLSMMKRPLSEMKSKKHYSSPFRLMHMWGGTAFSFENEQIPYILLSALSLLLCCLILFSWVFSIVFFLCFWSYEYYYLYVDGLFSLWN